MNAIARARATFLHECRDLLVRIEDGLQALTDDPSETEPLDAIFRAAHTIKGSAGLFGFQSLVEFTHEMESVLERVRGGELTVDISLIDTLLQCRDHLEALVDGIVDGQEGDARPVLTNPSLMALLASLAGNGSLATTERKPAQGRVGHPVDATEAWHISVRFDPDVYRQALSPTPVLKHLATIGELIHVETLIEAMPAVDFMDPESCYLGLEIQMRCDAGKTVVEDAFEFVRDSCQLRILPPGSRTEDFLKLIEELPEEPVRLGEILMRCGAVTARELEQMLGLQATAANRLPIGELVVSEGLAQPDVVGAAITKQGESRRQHEAEGKLIRVQSEKLDRLIDRVGELVIASAGVGQSAVRRDESSLLESVTAMARLVEDIREDAMRLRMVEIGETFNRFRRIVRDISRQLDKEADLSIKGAATELDKNVVEQIAEPLTHLVRNAIDHGIEDAVLRASRNKPARGRIQLSAHHEGGSVVVEVSDDGGGLDRSRILDRAREVGIIGQDASPTDTEVFNLIFAPGFSTARQVTDLSGRGVGMDVVKRSIEAMRGSIEIHSVDGEGTTFRIRLPLTLAIISGFLMAVGSSYYVTPLESVIECVELPATQSHAGYLDLRGEVLPLLHLREYFDVTGEAGRRSSVVVVSSHGHKAGLVVDRLDGEFQTVIKPMGQLFSQLVGIVGTTILGSGEVALLLDVHSLLARVAEDTRSPAAQHH